MLACLAQAFFQAIECVRLCCASVRAMPATVQVFIYLDHIRTIVKPRYNDAFRAPFFIVISHISFY
jgi:hypothetical protein